MFDPEKHHRRSIRLVNYDYVGKGAYFITVCTHDQGCLFGNIVDIEMRLNRLGEIADKCWRAIPIHFPNTQRDAWVVMPNHVHGIIVIDVGARHAVPLQDVAVRNMPQRAEQFGKPVTGSIPTIVRSFKSAATKRINEMQGTPGATVWQRNYYEHIIRDEAELDRIRQYIETNPACWAEDRENPRREGTPRGEGGPGPGRSKSFDR